MLINTTYKTGTYNFRKIGKDNLNEVITKDEKNTKYLYFENLKMSLTRIINNTKKKEVYVVYVFSSAYSQEQFEDKEIMTISLAKYNKNKCGAYVMNRLIVNCMNTHANRKFWKPIFWEVFYISIINSFIILKFYDKKINHKEFRLQLV